MLKNRAIVLGSLFILLVACGLRIYYMQFKSEAHMDEILSIVLSEYNEYGWTKPFDTNRIWNAKQMQEATLWNDSTLRGALSDVGNLWRNNRDDPHTNLYYSLFRLWHIGFVHTDSQSTFYRGMSLNFVFLFCAFYFAFLIARRIFGQNYFVLFFLSLAFLNPASISNTLFMRPYALQEATFLGFCYCLLKIFDFFVKRSFHKPFFLVSSHSIKKYLALWSGFVFMLFVGCIVFSFFTKESREAQLIAHSITLQEDKTYLLEGKMVFANHLFRSHEPYVILQSDVDSLHLTFTPLSIAQEENARYIRFVTHEVIQVGENIGSLLYTLSVSYKLYFALAIIYILGCICIYFFDFLSYEVLLLSVPTALLLLSGYFASIFVVMIFAVATLWAYKIHKSKRHTLFFIGSLVWALILTTLLYPRYLLAFRGYRSQEVGDKLSVDYLLSHCVENFKIFCHILISNLSWSIIIAIFIGIVITIFYALKYRTHLKHYLIQVPFALIFGICASLWAFGVIYIAPYKDLRYIMSVFPLLCLLPTYTGVIIYRIFTQYTHKYAPQYVIGGGLIVIYAFVCIWSVIPMDNKKITTLQYSNHIAEKYHQIPHIHTFAFMQNGVFFSSLIVPYLPDTYNMQFVNSCDDLTNFVVTYGEIEWITDEQSHCPLHSYEVSPFYHIGTIRSMIVRLKGKPLVDNQHRILESKNKKE
ncbi:hypothetical protein OQH61_07295 [Helicobacter sp. MIT 21-1697]|uniref:hypothetical protein n=1 Tax=Helicobacter sp. MIT 21-1697 TaxID=2993733 RepID=UPI00224A8A82|nr:hypothetical protein [Helicobacter sp. MIT 21-1697]MCX2717535.1 hypothetical protein [Helicobacter sp. MIT 21-1697]